MKVVAMATEGHIGTSLAYDLGYLFRGNTPNCCMLHCILLVTIIIGY